MKSTNRKRALIVSAAVILLSMTIIIGMTWALFTDTQRVLNHLQAGDLYITLNRVELTKTTLNTSGYLVEEQVQKITDVPVNFANPTGENVFGIETNEKIVPGSKFVATMQIENHSDVAFGYWIQIICTDTTNGEDLSKQLKVTVNTGSEQSDFVGNGLIVKGANGGYVDELAVGETGTFIVTVEFIDSFLNTNDLGYYENDLAQNETINFDLIVHAVQATTAPTP